MPRSYTAVYLHIVFSTKDRIPFLTDPVFRADLHSFLGGTARAIGCAPVSVGGTGDHVHMLCKLGKEASQAHLLKEVKRISSAWVKEQRPELKTFSWQGGYGAFSVANKDVRAVTHYIGTQEEHHRKRTFQEEYLELLLENGVEYDERWLWE